MWRLCWGIVSFISRFRLGDDPCFSFFPSAGEQFARGLEGRCDANPPKTRRPQNIPLLEVFGNRPKKESRGLMGGHPPYAKPLAPHIHCGAGTSLSTVAVPQERAHKEQENVESAHLRICSNKLGGEFKEGSRSADNRPQVR